MVANIFCIVLNYIKFYDTEGYFLTTSDSKSKIDSVLDVFTDWLLSSNKL